MEEVLIVEPDKLLARSLARAVKAFAPCRTHHSVREAECAIEETTRWRGFVINAFLPTCVGLDVLNVARSRGVLCPALIVARRFVPAAVHRAFALDARYVLDTLPAPTIAQFVTSFGWPAMLDRWTTSFHLSEGETDILKNAIQGCVHKDIAVSREVTHNTLKKEVRGLLHKTGDSTLAAAAIRLLRESAQRSALS